MHGFIKLWWLAFTTIAFTRKCQRGIKTVTIAMSAFLHCTSSLFFLKQWENDINQTCNILSTSCRCKRTIIERSVKAKILILRRLGSRQFLLANMTPFHTPFAYLGSWIKSKKFASERGAGTYFIFSALDKKCRFPTTCRKCLFFFTSGATDRVLSVTGLGWKTPTGNDEIFALFSANQWKRVPYVISTMVGSASVDSTIRHNRQSWR